MSLRRPFPNPHQSGNMETLKAMLRVTCQVPFTGLCYVTNKMSSPKPNSTSPSQECKPWLKERPGETPTAESE